jgi:hypothetical protein
VNLELSPFHRQIQWQPEKTEGYKPRAKIRGKVANSGLWKDNSLYWDKFIYLHAIPLKYAQLTRMAYTRWIYDPA